MSNKESMDNFTALYASYPSFTSAAISMHTTPRTYGIFVFFRVFFCKFMLYEFQVKDTDVQMA